MKAPDRPGSPPRTPRTSLGCLAAFLTPFFAAGLYMLWAGVHNLRLNNRPAGWGLLGAGAVFLTLPSLFLAFALRQHRRNAEQVRFESEHPDEPWLWREDWRAGRLRSGDSRAAAMFGFMAAAFLGLSTPALLAIPKEMARGNHAILVTLMFPLAGLGLGVAAVRAVIRRRKFGISELELHTLPSVIGGTFSGALEIPAKIRPTTGFKVRLLCVRRTTSGSGKNRSTHESVLWEDEKTLLRDYLEQEPGKTGLPVFFNVPADQPPSKRSNPAIVWRLEVTADVPGVDYAAQFEVPVFRTAESRDDAVPQPDPTAPFQPPLETWQPPADSRIRVTETMHGETEIHFPAARNPGVILGLIGFLAIWNVFLWLMLVKDAPIIFPIVWSLFDLILGLVLLNMLLHSAHVTAGNGELNVQHRWLLFGTRRTVPAADVASISLQGGAQSGTRVYYDLILTTKTGQKVTLGGAIPDKHHAEWLAQRLRSALGIKT